VCVCVCVCVRFRYWNIRHVTFRLASSDSVVIFTQKMKPNYFLIFTISNQLFHDLVLNLTKCFTIYFNLTKYFTIFTISNLTVSRSFFKPNQVFRDLFLNLTKYFPIFTVSTLTVSRSFLEPNEVFHNIFLNLTKCFTIFTNSNPTNSRSWPLQN